MLLILDVINNDLAPKRCLERINLKLKSWGAREYRLVFLVFFSRLIL